MLNGKRNPYWTTGKTRNANYNILDSFAKKLTLPVIVLLLSMSNKYLVALFNGASACRCFLCDYELNWNELFVSYWLLFFFFRMLQGSAIVIPTLNCHLKFTTKTTSLRKLAVSSLRALSKIQNRPAGPVIIFDNGIGFFKDFFFEKPSPSCILFRIWLIWLDS